jgi:hypothetical protein
MIVIDRKGYTNTDYLQADDQLSPRPPSDDKSVRRLGTKNDVPDDADEATQVPRPATSK